MTDARGQPVGGVNVRSFTNGSVQLLTLLSNPQLLVDELGTAEVHTNERFSKPQHLVVHFPTPMYVRDVRTKRDLGRVNSLQLTMDRYDPTVPAISSAPQPVMRTAIADTVKSGDVLTLSIAAPGTPSASQIYHVDVVYPSGKRSLQYSTNVFGDHIPGWAYEEPMGEVLDPVKFVNSYGFGLCYQDAPLLHATWEAVGMPARVWFLTGHTVAEVFYDGAYHYYDSDMMGYTTTGTGQVWSSL